MPSKNLYRRGEIWWARFKVGGTVYRQSLRTRSEPTARKRLKALRDGVEDEALFGIEGPVAWADAVVSWNEHAGKSIKPTTFKRYLVSLAQVGPFLVDKAVQKIDVATIRDMVRVRQRAGVSNATIRRDLTAISSVLHHAIGENWIEENVALAYSRKRIPERREPIVLPEQAAIDMMVAQAPARFGDMILFARETGMRQEEIAGLQYSSVDLKARTITLYRTKRSRPRSIPLNDKAIEIIGRQAQYIGSPYVFWRGAGERHNEVASRFGFIARSVSQKVAREGGTFARFRFHDLRHLYAVETLRSGKASLYDIQRLLGHSSLKTTEGYLDFLTPEEAKAAITGGAQSGAQERRSAK